MCVVVLTVHWPADAHLAHEAAPYAFVVMTAFHHLASHEVDHPLLTPAQGVDRLRAVHVVTCSNVQGDPSRWWKPPIDSVLTVPAAGGPLL